MSKSPMRKARTANRVIPDTPAEPELAGRVTLHNLNAYSKAGRKKIAAWLRATAKDIETAPDEPIWSKRARFSLFWTAKS